MGRVYGMALFSCAVLAFYYATRILYGQNRKKLTYKLLTAMGIASGIWNTGYGIMFITDSMKRYAYARAVGMLGIVVYMITGTVVIGVITKTIIKLNWIVIPELICGIAVMILVNMPGSYRMINSPEGIVTEFTSSAVAVIYTLYVVVVAFIFVILSVLMCRKSNKNQVQAVGRSFLRLEALILIGMVEDTILPAFGINYNIPASAMLQFVGLQLIYRALHTYDLDQINLENMVFYVYRTLSIPIFIFDEDHILRIANAEAKNLIGVLDDDLLSQINVWSETFKHEPPFIKDEKIPRKTTIDVVTGDAKKKYLKLSVDPIFDQYKDYLGYIVSVSDVTEHVEAL